MYNIQLIAGFLCSLKTVSLNSVTWCKMPKKQRGWSCEAAVNILHVALNSLRERLFWCMYTLKTRLFILSLILWRSSRHKPLIRVSKHYIKETFFTLSRWRMKIPVLRLSPLFLLISSFCFTPRAPSSVLFCQFHLACCLYFAISRDVFNYISTYLYEKMAHPRASVRVRYL